MRQIHQEVVQSSGSAVIRHLSSAVWSFCRPSSDFCHLVRYLADKLGIDPLEAAKEKLKINGMKYPIAKAKGSAKKYKEL